MLTFDDLVKALDLLLRQHPGTVLSGPLTYLNPEAPPALVVHLRLLRDTSGESKEYSLALVPTDLPG